MRRSAIGTSSARVRRWRHTPLSDARSDWHLIVDSVGRSGDYNMSTDVDLLVESARSGAKYVRLYRWDPPTLSIGRNQPFSAAAYPDLAVVRRPTGGKAVWHEHEVTYAVVAPIATFGSLRNAYCEIHTRIVRALRSLGVNAHLASHRPTVRPSDGPTSCFAVPVGGEILVAGRKVVGSAQVRRGHSFLQHGSILLAGSQQKVTAVTQEASLAAALGRSVTFDEITTAIVENWGERFKPSNRPTVHPSVGRSAVASPAPR
jgi:lipoate-protein ligase A